MRISDDRTPHVCDWLAASAYIRCVVNNLFALSVARQKKSVANSSPAFSKKLTSPTQIRNSLFCGAPEKPPLLPAMAMGKNKSKVLCSKEQRHWPNKRINQNAQPPPPPCSKLLSFETHVARASGLNCPLAKRAGRWIYFAAHGR